MNIMHPRIATEQRCKRGLKLTKSLHAQHLLLLCVPPFVSLWTGRQACAGPWYGPQYLKLSLGRSLWSKHARNAAVYTIHVFQGCGVLRWSGTLPFFIRAPASSGVYFANMRGLYHQPEQLAFDAVRPLSGFCAASPEIRAL